MAKTIAVWGSPRSGKTTFGSFIATLMNMPLIDTDAEICKKYNLILIEDAAQ